MILIEIFKTYRLELDKLVRHLTDFIVILFDKRLNTSSMVFILLFTLHGKSHALESRHLEVGVGLAGASLPHYRGSDQRRNYFAPFPYVLYEGERLVVNRDGGQFYFYSRPRLRVDVSAALSPPVFSDDNHVRQGMDDLHPVFELGPRLQLVLFESKMSRFRLTAAFPLRMAVASNLRDTRSVGFVFSPYLLAHFDHEWDADFSIGPIWASEKFHDYVYEVDPQFATTTRPAYDAEGGYSGIRFTFAMGQYFKSWWIGFFARYDDLSGVVFHDSPLVKREESFMTGAALSTIIYSGDL